MLRFTIRELLLATVIAALAVCWWIDRSRLTPIAAEAGSWRFRAESLAERVQREGWQVNWDEDEIFITQISADGTRRALSRNINARPLSPAEIQALLAAQPAGAAGAPAGGMVMPALPAKPR
jgi:hypothetical protein